MTIERGEEPLLVVFVTRKQRLKHGWHRSGDNDPSDSWLIFIGDVGPNKRATFRTQSGRTGAFLRKSDAVDRAIRAAEDRHRAGVVVFTREHKPQQFVPSDSYWLSLWFINPNIRKPSSWIERKLE